MQYRNTLGDTDGASSQAQALLALLRGFTVEDSWDNDRKNYTAKIDVNRWYNCREQGYTLSLYSSGWNQLVHVTFFEHRNHDSLCILVYQGQFTNPPNINDPEITKVFPNKYTHTASFSYGELVKAQEYVKDVFNKAYASYTKTGKVTLS